MLDATGFPFFKSARAHLTNFSSFLFDGFLAFGLSQLQLAFFDNGLKYFFNVISAESLPEDYQLKYYFGKYSGMFFLLQFSCARTFSFVVVFEYLIIKLKKVKELVRIRGLTSSANKTLSREPS